VTPAAAGRPLEVHWLGVVDYPEALERQERERARIRDEGGADCLLLVEHPPVITLGRSSRDEHLLESRESLAERGVDVHEASRGGDITYHAPGQLVGYPIIDLRARGREDVHRYLRDLEELLIEALAALGVPARRIEGKTGVFVRDERPGLPRKLASIGIGVRRWITWHGFALNVSIDPAGFDAIVPCGLQDVVMTSVQQELGSDAAEDLDARARDCVVEAFEKHFA
jgi:lipoyl(octanoyl) transferase